MSYLNFLKKELSSVQINCDFWDVRIEDVIETKITRQQLEMTTCLTSPSLGAFIRVRKNGFWLYQSTTQIDEIKKCLIELSQADAPAFSSSAKYTHPKAAPFVKISAGEFKYSDVGIDQKSKLVAEYGDLLLKQPNVQLGNVRYSDIYKVKSYLNSVGTEFEYDFNQGGIIIGYTLKNGENIFDDYTFLYGRKFSELQNQHDKIKNYVAESQQFLTAPAIAPGKYNIMMDPFVVGIFTHESFGHKSEADHMLGDEQSLKDWEIGKKIASDCLTIVDQGTFEGHSGYCPIDDEGIPAQKNYLIKNGVLAGRLHSVETARALNEKPTGNGRALNFEFEPIVRMTSTFIEAGETLLEDLVKKSTGALIVEGSKHGSGLSTFTIAPNRGYLVEAGGVKKPVRVTVISGSVYETLKNIEVVTTDLLLKSSAIGGCGKMAQWPLPVSYGGPYILVKDMQVS